VISKRIDTRANVRNSAKRKLSMCIEQIFDRIDAGYDFVFILKANIDNVPRENLLEEIGNALKKERLLND
jgi:ribonuclease P protein component